MSTTMRLLSTSLPVLTKCLPSLPPLSLCTDVPVDRSVWAHARGPSFLDEVDDDLKNGANSVPNKQGFHPAASVRGAEVRARTSRREGGRRLWGKEEERHVALLGLGFWAADQWCLFLF